MAETKPVERPLSPHIQIYDMTQMTAVSSVLHRATGHALVAGVMLGVWWLLAASVGGGYFDFVNWIATSWFGDLVFTASLWAVWYHYLCGLRHLYFDAGHGLELKTAEMLGRACIGGSVLLTLITILLLHI